MGFPEDFIWASASSAYQTEGGLADTQRGLGIWDESCHTLGRIENGATGDTACDSYHNYQTDVELLKQMGVNTYRFSISWTRLIPGGKWYGDGEVSNEGVDFYNNLINSLLDAGITPLVTLYHWNLPLALQNKFGGWQDEQIVDWYVKYAEVCFNKFGDRVKWWVTFNEPWVFTVIGYGDGGHAPHVRQPGEGEYQAAHNMLVAHGKTYRKYQETYNADKAGKMGIATKLNWYEPRNPYSELDIDATDRAFQFTAGWFLHPMLVNGDYSETMKKYINTRSKKEGRSSSRLPPLTTEEQQILKGSADFIGLTHYTTELVSHTYDSWFGDSNYFKDREADTEQDWTWPAAESVWLKEVPWGLRKLLQWLKIEYNDPAILITANGISESGDSNEANDWWRKQYFVGYINEMMKAMKMDDVNVIGYTAWSFMDQFEWDQGYSERFGSHWVNFTDPARPRVPKQSSYCYNEIIRRSFPEDDALACCQKYADCSPDVEPEEDIDECAGTTNPCGPNTVCTNTIGSYACSCLPGYTGDDAGCIDINECDYKDACGENEECMNTEGSFTCIDVTENDDCASNPCASNAVCESNLQGQGYTCSCEPGFNGDPYANGCIEDLIVSGFASFFGLSFDTMQSETAMYSLFGISLAFALLTIALAVSLCAEVSKARKSKRKAKVSLARRGEINLASDAAL